MVTSTPIKPSPSQRSDLPPDLLPSKYVPNKFSSCITPDVISRGKQHDTLQQSAPAVRLRHQTHKTSITRNESNSSVNSNNNCERIDATSDSDTDPNQEFAFISNTAKRAFFSESEGSSKSPSPTNERVLTRKHRSSIDNGKPNKSIIFPYDKEVVRERVVSHKHTFDAQDTKGSIRSNVVRRGLSLSNLLHIGGGSMVTRTFSHVSLCSAAESSATSSSSSVEGRRPQRTISQVTLTFKKLSTADSSSSSSRDELEQASKTNIEEKSKNSSRYRRSKSLPKSPQHSKRYFEFNTQFKQITRSTVNNFAIVS